MQKIQEIRELLQKAWEQLITFLKSKLLKPHLLAIFFIQILIIIICHQILRPISWSNLTNSLVFILVGLIVVAFICFVIFSKDNQPYEAKDLVLLIAEGGAILSLIFTYHQNELVTGQNKLVKYQNKLAQQQTRLQEASMRSSMVFLFSNIMDAMDRELKDDYHNNNIRDLSPQLVGRIVALTQRLRPYDQPSNSDSVLLSPERGQLLVALSGAQLDSSTMNTICRNADFRNADLKSTVLQNIKLRYINLQNADLTNSNFKGSDLRSAKLQGAKIDSANFEGANLRMARIMGSKRAKLDNAKCSGVQWEGANLSKIQLPGAVLAFSKLAKADLKEADLSEANLYHAHLDSADLRSANLKGVKLRGADLQGAKLHAAEVGKNFFKRITQEPYTGKDSVTGITYLKQHFVEDTTIIDGEACYILKNKERL